MSGHTPGPWRVQKHHRASTFEPELSIDADKRFIADIGLPPKDSEDRANARLIAAAPELLKAAYSILNLEGAAVAAVVGYKAHHGIDVKYHFDKVRAAIAKAEGRS